MKRAVFIYNRRARLDTPVRAGGRRQRRGARQAGPGTGSARPGGQRDRTGGQRLVRGRHGHRHDLRGPDRLRSGAAARRSARRRRVRRPPAQTLCAIVPSPREPPGGPAGRTSGDRTGALRAAGLGPESEIRQRRFLFGAIQ